MELVVTRHVQMIHKFNHTTKAVENLVDSATGNPTFARLSMTMMELHHLWMYGAVACPVFYIQPVYTIDGQLDILRLTEHRPRCRLRIKYSFCWRISFSCWVQECTYAATKYRGKHAKSRYSIFKSMRKFDSTTAKRQLEREICRARMLQINLRQKKDKRTCNVSGYVCGLNIVNDNLYKSIWATQGRQITKWHDFTFTQRKGKGDVFSIMILGFARRRQVATSASDFSPRLQRL